MSNNVVTKDFSQSYFSKRKVEKEKFKFWINSTYIALLTIISMLLLYYVWIQNVNATKWYNIRELENEKKNILMEKEQQDVKIAEKDSFSNTTSGNDLLNMKKVVDPDYLVINDNVQYVYNYQK